MRHRPSSGDKQNHRSDDLFWARPDQIVRSDHLLVRLAGMMPLDGIGKQVADLLPPTPGGAGRADQPRAAGSPIGIPLSYGKAVGTVR